MPKAKIFFVPGVMPKPPPEIHRRELLRCLLVGLERALPDAAELLEREPERFIVYDWNFGAYGEHRDIDLDRDGIERLLAAPEPSDADIAEIKRSLKHTSRLVHIIGDRYPALGRMFAPERLRASLSDVRGYLRDVRGEASKVRAGLRQRLGQAWAEGDRIIVIGHSLGSVIAYDTFWELSHETPVDEKIDLFVTLGSPLATRFVGELIKGADEATPRRYPTIIRHWANFWALGDTAGFFPGFEESFAEMKSLGLLETLVDFHGLYNHFHGQRGLNVHMSYGYLVHREVAGLIGEALLRGSRVRS